MRYLITGSNGQLAGEFSRRLRVRTAEFRAVDETACDITDQRSVEAAVASYRPDVILNCAAYNLVDRAEQEKSIAIQVNAEGPRVIAEAARRHGSRMVHFSSDYVFDGSKNTGLYEESDHAQPLNEYGRSKLAGEVAVREVLGDRALILRLSWVFGAGTQNFIHKFLERVDRREPLAVSCDEFSVPTWTGTVAEVTLAALGRDMTGLYHLTNSGYCSRFEWARAVLQALDEDRFVRPVAMESFVHRARRPKFSAMSNRAISTALDIAIEPWEDAVRAFVRQGRDA